METDSALRRKAFLRRRIRRNQIFVPAAHPAGTHEKGTYIMSKEKLTKAEKKAAKAEAKALKAAKKATKIEKKATKVEKKAAKAAKKAAKKGGKPVAAPAAPVTKKAAVFGHPVRNLLIAAIIGVVLGVVFILPQTQNYVYYYCCYAAGGILALVGLVYIILYFARKPVSGEYHSEFGMGLVAVLAGAYVALSNMLFADSGMEITFTVIAQLIGIAALLAGVMKLQYCLDLGRMGYKKWWIVLITSVLGLAVGVFVTFFMDIITMLYYNTGYSVMTILGALFCLNGVLDLIAMTVVAVRNRKASKAAALAEAEQKVAAYAVEPVEVYEPVEEELIEEPIEEIVVEVVEVEEEEEPAPEIEVPEVVEEAAEAEEEVIELPEPAQAEPAAE